MLSTFPFHYKVYFYLLQFLSFQFKPAEGINEVTVTLSGLGSAIVSVSILVHLKLIATFLLVLVVAFPTEL